MRGLLNRSSLHPFEGLVIERCKSIHMIFMRFAIDVVFIGKDNKVVGLVKNIKPFYLSSVFLNAEYAIEVPVGTIEQSKTEIGDLINIT